MAYLARRFSQSVLRPTSTSPISYLSKCSFAQKQQKAKETRHVLTIGDLSNTEIENILKAAAVLKSAPLSLYNKTLENKTLLMFFEKVSLRTRVSFQVGMAQLGGTGIFYSIEHSPLGVKETFGDTGEVLSRYCDGIMARVNNREHVRELANHSSIPVINGLDDWAHPTQMLSDLLTIKEHKIVNDGATDFKDLKFVYFGDIHNNVTYDLMRACSIMGFGECVVCGPLSKGNEYNLEPGVLDECKLLNNGCKLSVTEDVAQAAKDADVIYTDSWMSYGILKELQDQRMKIFEDFRVTADVMKHAKPDCKFMNCLPAMRGHEQTAEVIDGPQSVVFDQAENRLHAQKALLLYLMNGNFNDNDGDSSRVDNFSWK
eukprot:CAMPEP_0197022434 /NCGR_PEP_ID=MMETSP1384-20130603/3319_1 /TAXON_ID=29189 /ORGANISM="Ammonia sp." /LENGTH=372 /DNA_ID=CAMNT_0042450479 /DNA_START=39 /DNA_END=1157 /DNA_ORIENTATION=+